MGREYRATVADTLAAECLAVTIDGKRLFIDYEATATESGYVSASVMLDFGAHSTGGPAGLPDVVCFAPPFQLFRRPISFAKTDAVERILKALQLSKGLLCDLSIVLDVQ
jgi:hypothetical protein